MTKENLVSGMRPTGKLHLGHYLGVLRNWVQLQNSEKYNCFFMIADWHSLTTKTDTKELGNNIIEVARDWFASGLDPAKGTIYVQSAVPQIAELHLLLSMITPNNWVERDPTLKDLVKAAAITASRNASDIAATDENDLIHNVNLTYGMLGYPILQTADILTFCGSLVPVGKDQVAHIEISREIARRFNNIFDFEFFPEPRPLLTDTPTVPGLDGNKMSKSFNNDIKISATEEETIKDIKTMITDTQRVKRSDPGDTGRCQVPFPYYKIFADEATIAQTKLECETALRGCIDCKRLLADIINEYFKPIRDKRNSFTSDQITKILREGNESAREKAEQNLQQIRKIMKLNNY